MSLWAMLVAFGLVHGSQNPAPPLQDKPPALAPYVERFQRQFNFSPGGKIQISAAVPGNLKIIGWKRPSVLLEAEKIFYQVPPEEARRMSEQFPISVRYGATSSTIQTSGLAQNSAAVEVNMTVYVPKEKTDLKIQLIQGDLSIGAINGWVEADLKEGSLEAKSMQGYFSLVTASGDLSVEMAGRRWDGLGFAAATLRGRVALRLPAEYSTALQLETREGDIIINYPEQRVAGETVPYAVVTGRNGRSLTTTLGEGGASVRVNTAAGDIHLSTTQSP